MSESTKEDRDIMEWTQDHHRHANRQGWNVFIVSYEPAVCKIQKIDEMDVFESDDEAIKFVVKSAASGDPVCQAALQIAGDAYVKRTN